MFKDLIEKVIQEKVGKNEWYDTGKSTGVYQTLELHRKLIDALTKHIGVHFESGDSIVVKPNKKSKNK